MRQLPNIADVKKDYRMKDEMLALLVESLSEDFLQIKHSYRPQLIKNWQNTCTLTWCFMLL